MLRHSIGSPPDQATSRLARFLLLLSLIVAAAALRLVPHPPNFAPLAAMALFGGASFATRLAPFAGHTVLPSDLVLGLHVLVPVVYGSFALNTLLGRRLRSRRQFVPVAVATLAGSMQFFVVTNFACWLLWYPHTPAGLAACYVAALPFVHKTLLGDATFAGVMFAPTALAEAGFRVFRERALAAVA
jgi:hypothetical protein